VTWKVKQNGTPGLMVIGRGLSLALGFEWDGREPVETAAVEYWVDCMGENMLWGIERMPLGPQELGGHSRELGQYLPLKTDSRRIEWIEAKRNGGGPVTLNVHCNVYARPISTATMVDREGKSFSMRALGIPGATTVGLQMAVERDQWLRILNALGWGETEVFEIAAEPFQQNGRLNEALAHLRAAENAMRLGHWSGAVTEARKAVEVAARIDGDMAPGDRKQAYEALVSEILPGPANGARRETVGDLMQALAHLRHEGAHGSVTFQFERADAEVSLRLAIALFRYLGVHVGRARQA
jgi:hypothetical protein